MNLAHLHILLNHKTVVAVILATLLLIFSFVKKKSQLTDMSFILVILAALWTLPAYLTGHPAKEMILTTPSVPEKTVSDHQNMALLAFILIEVTGLLAAASLASKSFTVISSRIFAKLHYYY